MRTVLLILSALAGLQQTNAFVSPNSLIRVSTFENAAVAAHYRQKHGCRSFPCSTFSTTSLNAVIPDPTVVAVIAEPENYGLAIACAGEALWSFAQSPPSIDHAFKTLFPALVASSTLVTVSGPMITSGDAVSLELGLCIATLISIGLGTSYFLRMIAPSSTSNLVREVAGLGLLVATAGFFAFGHNLVVDDFVTMPSIPEFQLDIQA